MNSFASAHPAAAAPFEGFEPLQIEATGAGGVIQPHEPLVCVVDLLSVG